MKRAAFVIGYAGSIFALIIALTMIFTVPASILTSTIDEVKDDLDNEHILAFNDVALAAIDGEITDYSKQSVMAMAQEMAQTSIYVTDEDVYEEAVRFVYKVWQRSVTSVVLIGVTIIFAIVAFIGSIVCKKHPKAGGVMMLVAALVTILSAIYTETIIPMIVASALLTIGGVFAFVPKPQPISKRMMPQAAGTYYPPVPEVLRQPIPKSLTVEEEPQKEAPIVQEKTDTIESNINGSVPFPEEEVQVFAQSADDEVKE